MKNTKQLSLSAGTNHPSPVGNQLVASSLAVPALEFDSPVNLGIDDWARGYHAGADWASTMEATGQPWCIEALRLAIEQWHFDPLSKPPLPSALPTFMSPKYFEEMAIYAGHAAVEAAQGKLSFDYMRGFGRGTRYSWRKSLRRKR